MSLDISLETEARIQAKAKEQGLSVDAYLESLIEPPKGVQGLEILKALGIKPSEVPELPVWNLGVRGSLRRCEIYDDLD
jgi:hypothetical protein